MRKWLLIAVSLVIVILISFYLVSPLNRISQTTVSGDRTVPQEKLLKSLRARPGDSFSSLLLDWPSLRRGASVDFPQLKWADLRISSWGRVHVNVREYPIIARFVRNGRSFAVTSNGRVSKKPVHFRQDWPLLFGFGNRLKRFRRFLAIYNDLPKNVKLDVHQIRFSPTTVDPDRILVKMNDGNQVVADFKTWQTKMKYYPIIARSMKARGIINLEVGAYSYRRK